MACPCRRGLRCVRQKDPPRMAKSVRASVRDAIVKKAADRGIKLLDGGNPPVPENAVAQSSAPVAIQLLAEQHGGEVVQILLNIAIDGESEAARVEARTYRRQPLVIQFLFVVHEL